MNLLVVQLLLGTATTTLGAAVSSGLWWSHFRHKANAHNNADAQHAAEVLVRLQELATRVAFDVDEHSSRVEEINDKLTSSDKHEPTMIVDVVAKLIEANQHMHEKLASTEGKLREQAQEIQSHAAEARTDALTMLANRRAFDNELARRFAEFGRQGRTYSLIMVDVDHFKRFNDTHGHQAGDEVLRSVAKVLRRKMREMDIVARYGGEEFAIILPGMILDEAGKAALRACTAIEKSPFRYEGKELRVTASFGVTEIPGSADSAAIITRADKALYAAKAGGRNCAYSNDGKNIHHIHADQPRPLPKPADQPPNESIAGDQAKGEKPVPHLDSRTSEPKTDSTPAVQPGALADLPNRTAFCQQVRNRTAECKRGGPTFSIALIEVNRDNEGDGLDGQRMRELVADATFRSIAVTVREMDFVGCYSPGCFALLLPTAGLADAIRIGERLRERFSEYFPPAQGEQPRLALSIGLVQIMERDDSISVLRRAEAALDAADRRGGNRAYYHDGERCAPITAMLETMGYLS